MGLHGLVQGQLYLFRVLWCGLFKYSPSPFHPELNTGTWRMAPSLIYDECLLTYILVLFMMAVRSCVTPVKPWAVWQICHLREQLYLPAAVPPPPQKSPPLLQVTGPSTKVGRLLSLYARSYVIFCCLILYYWGKYFVYRPRANVNSANNCPVAKPRDNSQLPFVFSLIRTCSCYVSRNSMSWPVWSLWWKVHHCSHD
jgi:hypothetical protein